MHWEWKIYPFAWQGIYKGHVGACSGILEAMTDYDMWILHTFYEMVGSHNDINVLQHSPVFKRLAKSLALEYNYEINDHRYNKGTTYP